MNHSELKELVDNMCDIVEQVGTQGGLNEGVGNAARMELGMFMMYLSASDGTIEWEEADFISEMCNLNLNPNNVADFIRENNIYSTEFETKVPITFQIMVKADNELKKLGIDKSGSEILLQTYKIVGKILVDVDDDIDDNEASDYTIYINMLERYRDANLLGGSGVSGFTKNGSSSVSVPSTIGSSPKYK